MKAPDKVDQPTHTLEEHSTQGPISRWSRRKQAVVEEQQRLQQEAEAERVRQEQDANLPTDADMPDIDSLTEDSDYSGFLSPKVSESLRRMALRKLFHSPGFNIVDGLDDYDEDFTSFEALGNILTADMKHQIEQEARKKLELTETEGEQPEGGSEQAASGMAAQQDLAEEQTEPERTQDELASSEDESAIVHTEDEEDEEDPDLG